jgi:hypothetical protein
VTVIVTAEDGEVEITSTFTVVVGSPVLTDMSSSSVTATSILLSFTSDSVGTFYYLVLASADSAPRNTDVVAQGSALFKGTGSVTDLEQTLSISGLSPETTYKIYLVVKDESDLISGVSTIEVTTTAAPVTPPAPVTVPLSSQSAIAVVVPASLEVGKTATLTTTGGAASGTNTFFSNSATICTVTSAGVVTAVAAGTCSVYAQRTASGFTTAVSADATFKVLSAAEVKAIEDAAIKAAADKAVADAAAAAAKAAADKVEAEARAAEAAVAAAAEVARVEAVRLAGLNRVTSIKRVKGKTSIALNLADQYAGSTLQLQLRRVVNGKVRYTTIRNFVVKREDGVVTVSTKAKIAKGQRMRIMSEGKAVRYFRR